MNWKKLLKKSFEESKRNLLSVEDLTTKHVWRFSFKQNRQVFFNTCFAEDFTLVIDRLIGDSFVWKIIDLPNGRNAVQVNFFPYLQANRCKDWSWTLQNAYVILTSAPNDHWNEEHHPCTISLPPCINPNNNSNENFFNNYFIHFLHYEFENDSEEDDGLDRVDDEEEEDDDHYEEDPRRNDMDDDDDDDRIHFIDEDY
eukprot:TRINITY_DN2355_c0_g1_i1.p1 TRINITY_DN2355_c0_g1~~TRINITY_DN2355_c0_g1_i1.p1  ORF type:complete len:199 (-),score=48.52 TRINITY_DN2355_c0_g1_i1:22-618(-)